MKYSYQTYIQYKELDAALEESSYILSNAGIDPDNFYEYFLENPEALNELWGDNIAGLKSGFNAWNAGRNTKKFANMADRLEKLKQSDPAKFAAMGYNDDYITTARNMQSQAAQQQQGGFWGNFKKGKEDHQMAQEKDRLDRQLGMGIYNPYRAPQPQNQSGNVPPQNQQQAPQNQGQGQPQGQGQQQTPPPPQGGGNAPPPPQPQGQGQQQTPPQNNQQQGNRQQNLFPSPRRQMLSLLSSYGFTGDRLKKAVRALDTWLKQNSGKQQQQAQP